MMQSAVAEEHASWGFEEGDEIAPGRSVLRTLGGGNRFEVMLVWDDRLFAIMVAKVIRPDQADSSKALRELREEAEALERLAHPVLVRGFDAVLEGPHPHVLIEHLEGPTRGNTDPRADTGHSTSGETDGRDGTGKTERR
jgi:eukaryotic-like serine/threonine-protein kinase